jgi:hypothetical protein
LDLRERGRTEVEGEGVLELPALGWPRLAWETKRSRGGISDFDKGEPDIYDDISKYDKHIHV